MHGELNTKYIPVKWPWLNSNLGYPILCEKNILALQFEILFRKIR